MNKIASIIALSIASSFASTAASASMVNVSGTLGSWKAFNAALKAPIPYFVAKSGVDLVQATVAGANLAAAPTWAPMSINLVGTVDSVTGFGTLSQVGSFTGYYDVDSNNITDDSYVNSGVGGSVSFTGLTWTLDATGMHQTGGTASGCESSAAQCAFTVSGVNANDHLNGLGQSVFDFQGINAGFQTLPRSNAAQTTYGSIFKAWAATPGLAGSWSGSTFTGAVASRINSGAAGTNAANTSALNLTTNANLPPPPPPNSENRNWIGTAAVALWSAASNWDTNAAPDVADRVNLTNAGYPDQTVTFDNTANSEQLDMLTIGSGMTLKQTSGDLNVTSEIVGSDDAGHVVQDGGTHSAGTLRIGTSQYDDYFSGMGQGGTGTYTLNGGDLDAAFMYLGLNASDGQFIQNGGTSTVTTLQLGSGYVNEVPVTNCYGDDYGGYCDSYTQYDQYQGTATYTLNNGTLNVGNITQGDYANSRLVVNGGTLNLTGSSIAVDNFDLGFAAGSNASFTLGAGKTLTAGNLTIGSNYNGVGTFTQNGGANSSSYTTINRGSYIQNAGTVNSSVSINNGSSYIQNGGTKSYDLTINNGSYVQNGGTNNSSSTTIHNGSYTQNAGVNNMNALTIKTNGSYALNGGSLNVNYNINNAGQLTIAAGTMVTGNNTFTQTAGLTRVDGTLTRSVVNIQGGTLLGNGVINAPVNVTGGTISAGNSIGALTINGVFTLSSGGTLLAEIGGTGAGEFDVLTVNGDVNLNGGTVAVSFGDDFTAQAGDEWEIVKGNVVGSVENVIFAYSEIPQGLNFIVSKTLTGLKVSAVQVQAVPVPAAAWLMGTGLISLSAIKRRKKAA